jgi:hypothetical protein
MKDYAKVLGIEHSITNVGALKEAERRLKIIGKFGGHSRRCVHRI